MLEPARLAGQTKKRIKAMRTKTTTQTVYKFQELPVEIQDKILSDMWDINVDFEWWDCDGLTGFSQAEINKHHLKPNEWKYDLLSYKKMYFDLDRGQYIQFVDCEFANDETARKFLGVPRDLWLRVSWSFVNSREYNTRLDYETAWDYDGTLTDKQTAILDKAVERFSDKVHEVWRSLRDSYEYLTSREAILETIEANNYEFTAEGDIA